ncbi:hypothetical protein [Streptomyces sp. NRRL S-920]|uniref:hypothetical protein n=1 Tax=Streptomyces sp. NRRL S-920 TaxID=1463921 RepID=UPI00131B1192|nr:hypothetical protein [Streptomyces sp. NRRL S-920]
MGSWDGDPVTGAWSARENFPSPHAVAKNSDQWNSGDYSVESNLHPPGASASAAAGLAESLWTEILGPDADTGTGFLENGGDSFRAVLLTTRLYELTGREIEYLDVLEADGAKAIARLLTTETPGS